MAAPTARLAFCKFNVSDMSKALKFFENVFSYTIVKTFDEPDFLEHILEIPGQADAPNLLLVNYKDDRPISVGTGHGPIGFMTDDVEALYAKAIKAGAGPVLPPFETQGIRLAIFTTPDGHEVELVQPPTAQAH